MTTTAKTPRDEAALRRPGFSPGHAVRLADGQEWTFPKPTLVLTPARRPDGTFGVRSSDPFGPEHQRHLEAVMEGGEGMPWAEYQALRIGLAASLLCRNYDLDDEALADLLPYDLAGDSTAEMWRRLDRVAMGFPPEGGAEAPKPSAVGSGPS